MICFSVKLCVTRKGRSKTPYKYTDNKGNRFRSWQEIKVANLLSLLTNNYPEVEILVITSYAKKAKTYLNGIARVNILIWRELEKVADWCWEAAPG